MTLIDSDSCHDHEPLHAAPSAIARFLSSPVRVVLLAVGAVLLIDAGGSDSGPGVCVFRRCTGGYCPGCGMTRAARHLTRGQFGAAWNDHPWAVLATVQLAIAGVVYAGARWIGKRIDWGSIVLPVGLINVALILGIWIVRLADGSIPRFF